MGRLHLAKLGSLKGTDDAIVLGATLDPATYDDLAPTGNVIFIHGFTSCAVCCMEISDAFEKNGLRSFIFDYDSYCGIDRAARSLAKNLSRLLDSNSGRRDIGKSLPDIALIGHSMGGLVARTFISDCSGKEPLISKVVTLGTPHHGTLMNRGPGFQKFAKSMKELVEFSEDIFFPTPNVIKSSSLYQLTCSDESKPEECFIHSLNKSWEGKNGIPVLSVSGGNAYLRVSGNELANRGFNAQLQRLFEEPNDGLVEEKSSSIIEVLGSRKGLRHCNEYDGYWQQNHNDLIKSCIPVNKIIMAWLRGI